MSREFCVRPVKNETWFIKDFYTIYTEKKIRKPRIQRQKCWSDEQSKEYIQFIAAHENTCLPLSVNETEYNGSNVYMLFDGNNRTNAILDFYHKPLSLFQEVIPDEFEHIKQLLRDTHLNVLLKKKYTYPKFCKDNKCTPNATCDPIQIEDLWDGMIDFLDNLNFAKVRIQITVYDRLTNEEMQHIYQSINRGGMVLTEQDLLASSLANQQYDDIPSNIISSINDYYDDMNQEERLQMTESVNRLNLFEILMGLQILLHETYGFIPEPNATKDLDIVFYIWKLQHGFAHVASTEQVIQFIKSIQDACADLQDILNRMYDTSFGFHKFHRIKKTHVITSILYFLYDVSEIQVKKQYIHKAIMYHAILVELYTDDSISPEDRARDIFWRVSGGSVLSAGVYKQLMTRTFEARDITKDRLRDALHAVMKVNIHYVKTRKTHKWFEALALTAFYNQQVPSNTKLLEHEIDHIVPYSVRKQLQVDICRVGNKQIIPAKINASRKTKPITDKFVTENKLMYQQYPTGEEYAAIYDGTILHVDKFNEMCTRREQMYIEHILTSYHY